MTQEAAMEGLDRLLTTKDVLAWAGISAATLYRMIDRGATNPSYQGLSATSIQRH